MHSGTVLRGKPLANVFWTCNTERWLKQIFQRHHVNKEKEKNTVIKHGRGDTKCLWKQFTCCVAERCDCHARLFISQLWNWSPTDSRLTFHDVVGWFTVSSLTRNCVSLVCNGLWSLWLQRNKEHINSNISPYYTRRTPSASPRRLSSKKPQYIFR